MSAEPSPPAIIYTPSPSGALRQGEIVSAIRQPRLRIDTIFDSEPVVMYETHPLAIIVTQDCDLEQDYRARNSETADDKRLPNILFCQVMPAIDARANKNERYHFFQAVEKTQESLQEGLPELYVDFKRYFTLPADEVYERLKASAHRRCHLLSPYLEHFSTRFAYYQFRVALPSDHLSQPA
jgi:hypothetical protein